MRFPKLLQINQIKFNEEKPNTKSKTLNQTIDSSLEDLVLDRNMGQHIRKNYIAKHNFWEALKIVKFTVKRKIS